MSLVVFAGVMFLAVLVVMRFGVSFMLVMLVLGVMLFAFVGFRERGPGQRFHRAKLR